MVANRILLALVASAAGFGLTAGARAAEPFAGKVINIYVGSGAGGVYDVFGRLVQRHMGKYIPGQPSITVQPMPGAGGITASNFVYNVAPKDGTALGIVSPSLGVMETAKGARYESSKYAWIGRIVSTVNVTYTYGQGRVTSLDEARTKESSIAVTGAGAALSIFTRVLAEVGGVKFKAINGYTDAAASVLALERGEVDGVTSSWNSLKNMRPHWLQEKTAHVLVQYALKSHSQLQGIPLAVDLAKTAEDRELLVLFMSAAEIGLALMAPPQTPAENVAILRNAFSAMLDDAEFKADAAKIEPDFDPLPGGPLQDVVVAARVDKPQLLERVRRIVNSE